MLPVADLILMQGGSGLKGIRSAKGQDEWIWSAKGQDKWIWTAKGQDRVGLGSQVGQQHRSGTSYHQKRASYHQKAE